MSNAIYENGDSGVEVDPTLASGLRGAQGWSMVTALIADGERRVRRVVDWTGGEGIKPALGGYLGPLGLVNDIADATDDRGPKGDSGDVGDPGPQGKSAYQIAVDNGFLGTELEWLNYYVNEIAEAATSEAIEASEAAAADAAAALVSEGNAAAAAAAAAAGGVIYDTPALGIAATVDGQFFIVKGDGVTTYALMYKNVVTVATLIASYASKAAMDVTNAEVRAVESKTRYFQDLRPVDVGGRLVQPTELSFDLKVIRGVYLDDGSQFDPTLRESEKLKELVLCPAIEVDGRPFQPTTLSFDLRVLDGFYLDDGSPYGAPASSNFPRVERQFAAYAAPILPQRVAFQFNGQSNSIGSGGSDLLTTTAFYSGRVLMFNGGTKAIPADSATSMISTTDMVATVGVGARGEDIVPGACYGFLERAFIASGADLSTLPKIFGHSAGITALTIAGLTHAANYPYFVTSVQEAYDLRGGDTYAVGAIIFDQGESNQGITSQSDYRTQLRNFYNKMVATIVTTTGQAWNPPMLVCQKQFGSQSTALTPLGAANTYPASVTLGVPEEQGNNIFIAFPDYSLPYTADVTHRTAAGHKLAGRYYARALERILVRGQEWRCLEASHAWINGLNCFIKLEVPVQPIVIDTSAGGVVQWGFKINDGSGDLPIVGATVVDGDTLRLTLGRLVNGTPTLRYALDQAAATGLNGGGGCLRDSDVEIFSVAGVNHLLANWCLSFQLEPLVMGN